MMIRSQTGYDLTGTVGDASLEDSCEKSLRILIRQQNIERVLQITLPFKLSILYLDAMSVVLAFSTLAELANFSRVNRKYYHLLKDKRLNHLWVNAAPKAMQAPRGSNKYDIQIFYQLTNKPALSLEALASNDHENAFAIMHSNLIKPILSDDEKILTSVSRNKAAQFTHATAGLFLGLSIGILFTLLETVTSLLMLLVRTFLIFGSVGLLESLMHTSKLRLALGITCLPFYSILQSAYLGASYGWRYGLPPLSTLGKGISIFHNELYSDRSRDDRTPYDLIGIINMVQEKAYSEKNKTDIHRFFKDSHFKTVADKANQVEKRKPQLRFFESNIPAGPLELKTSAPHLSR